MNLDNIAEVVFEVCADKSKGTVECVESIVKALNLEMSFFGIEDAVRDYRLSGKSLSETATMINRAIGGIPEIKMVTTRVVCNNTSAITFDSALEFFTEAGFTQPKNAATLAVTYLMQIAEADGELLNLEGITELYGTGNHYEYDGKCYSCLESNDLLTLTTDAVAECIAESAYDMAVDEVANMTLEEAAERWNGYCTTDVKVVVDPSGPDIMQFKANSYVIIAE